MRIETGRDVTNQIEASIGVNFPHPSQDVGVGDEGSISEKVFLPLSSLGNTKHFDADRDEHLDCLQSRRMPDELESTSFLDKPSQSESHQAHSARSLMSTLKL